MEEEVVLTKTSYLTLKRVFIGKSMRIHKLEKDNEKLRKAFQTTNAHHAGSTISQDLIENVAPASSPSSQEVPQERSQETVGQGDSALSLQNQIAVSYQNAQHSYLTSALPLVSSGYPAANEAFARVPNASSNAPPFSELHNPPSQVSQQLPRSQVQQPNPGVLQYPAFSETRNAPRPPRQNFPNFHSSSASVSFQPNQMLSYQSSVPMNGHQSSAPVHSHQLSVPVNSHQSLVPVNSYQSSMPVNSHQSSVPVNSHRSLVPVNSHRSLVPVNSHQYQSSVPVNSHQSSVPVNRTQAYSQVQHRTFHAPLTSHHQPQPRLPVLNRSHFRNLRHSQPQNCPQATLQGPSLVVHHYPQISQPLQNVSSNTSTYHQPQAFKQPQHQTYPASQLPYPGIQNASPNQVQQHHPPNRAIPQQRLRVRHDLHSLQSFTNSTSQNQSSFGRVPDMPQGTVTSQGCQLSGEQGLQYTSTASRGGNDGPLWLAASKEVSPANASLLPKNNNFSNVLCDKIDEEDSCCVHDVSDEEDPCCIIHDSRIVATNKSHGQSPFTRLQNSSNTYPTTESGNSCQTDNYGQATITSEPFTCPGPSKVNTKTDSLPSVITPPLTPPTPNSSRPVQLKSNAHCNVTFMHDPNLSPVQNLFTPQPVPLSTRDQPTLNHNSSKAPLEVDAHKKSELASHSSFVSDQRFQEETVDMPVSDRDSPSISLGTCDSELRRLSVPLPDIIECEADSVSSTSVKESSVSLVNSKPSSTSPLAVEEAPEGLVISESCATGSSVAGEGSKDKVLKSEASSTNTFIMAGSRKTSVTAEDRFVEEGVKVPTSMKGEKIAEEETNDKFVVESSDGKFKSVDLIRAAFPGLEEAEGSRAAMNNEYLLKSSCSLEHLDEVTEYVSLLGDVSRSESNGHNSKKLSEGLPLDKTNKHDPQGQNSTHIDSHDENSDFHGKNDTCIDSRTKCDSRSSDSQNLNDGGVNSRDTDSQEVTKNEKCKPSQVQGDSQEATLKDISEGGSSPCGLPTLHDLPPPQEASNLHCEENCLIITLQKDRKTVNCPEECPMCYTVLCPSRFSVNLKTFHLASRCIGCGLFITIKFENCNEPFESERTLKRPGSESITGTGSSKKPTLAN